MRFNKLRISAGILAVLMVTTAFAGCNGGENTSKPDSNAPGSSVTDTSTTEASQEPEEVRDFDGAEFVIGSHWARQFFQEPGKSPEGDLINKRIEELEEKYNCTFSYVEGTAEGFATDVMTALAAGMKYADLIDSNLHWYFKFQTAGYLEPLEDVADLRLDDSTWYPLYSNIAKGKDGKTYGVNFLTWYHLMPNAYHMLYFNKRILEDKNLESPYTLMEKGEWNWDNFRSLVRSANDPQNGIYGLSSIDRHLEMAAIRSNGCRPIYPDETGKLNFGLDDEKAYAALNFISDIINVDKAYDPASYDGRGSASTLTFQDTIKKFCDGNIAFFAYHTDCLTYSGFLDSMEDDFGVIAFPKGPSGTSDYNGAITGDTRIWSIPITADDKERSGFLLRKLAQPLEGTTADSWKETARRKYFRDDEGFQQFLNLVENADGDYNWLDDATITGSMIQAFLSVTRDKAKTPAEAIGGISSSIEALLNTYNE